MARRAGVTLAGVASILLGAVTPAVASAGPVPVITNYGAQPSAIPYTGGSVTVSADVSGASSCTFSGSGHALTGLPATVACGSGSASAVLSVAENISARTRTFRVKLTATGSSANAAAVTLFTESAAPPKPTIADLSGTPDPLPYTGGLVTLSATVTDGSECTFSSPSPSIGGLPETVSCGTGTVSTTAAVTANATTVEKKLTIKLLVIGPAKSATARGEITLSAAPPPSISSVGASPSPVSWTGGQVQLSAAVDHATSCTFSGLKKARHKVSGLPATVACSSGSASVDVTVAANHKRRLATYTVKLTAAGSGKKVTSTTEITVSPVTTPPTISSFTANPSPVPASGGPVTLSATVANAVSCSFSAKNPAVSGLPETVPCSNSVSVTVSVPPNTAHRARSYVVKLTVRGEHKKVTGSVLVTVSGRGHA